MDPSTTGSISQANLETGREFERGTASWYGPGFHGRKTASGERFNSNDMTAAHRFLPFGTRLRVVNESNGRSVVVRVNDRGPFAHRRIIDLAKGPAQALGLTTAGVGYVSLHRLN
jgi:rare lipoprotein A